MMDEKQAAVLRRRYGNRVSESGMHTKGPGRMIRARGGKKPKEAGKTAVRLFRYIGRCRVLVLLSMLFVTAGTGTGLAAAYLLRPIINRCILPLTGQQADPEGLAAAVAVMLGLYGASVLCTWIQSRLMLTAAQDTLARIRLDLFRHIQALPLSRFDGANTGDLMSRFTNDVDAVGTMMSSTLIQLLSGTLSIAGTLVLMLCTSIPLTVITVLMVPVMLWSGSFAASRGHTHFRAQQEALGALNGYIEETIKGQKTVKVFGREALCEEEFGCLNDEFRKKQVKAQLYGEILGPLMGALTQVNYTLTAGVGAVLCIYRNFDLGGLAVFLNFSRRFSRPINEISMQLRNVFSALAGAERVFGVLDMEPEQEPDPAAEIPECVRGEVEFQGVSFGYRPEEPVLNDISFSVGPGQKAALVGSTGAGKTTAASLISRFYEVTDGRITLDGIDIRRYPRDRLRQQVAVVLQDIHLFEGTIRENIRYGRLNATDEEVEAAARMSSAHPFIMRLPDGYDTLLEKDGANLSQGQRQLISIARAAVSRAPVLVLDEATSSVDTRTEKQIETGMDQLMRNRTALVIAHRLSTVRDADLILVLEEGRIIERGSHEQLMRRKGRYYELCTGAAALK